MNISERDIFNFVFFDKLLSKQKKVFINKNSTDFEQIDFYRKLKQKLDFDVDRKTKEIIASKISAYHRSKQYNLLPVTKYFHEKLSHLEYSADIKSGNKANKNTETFVDEDEQFIVRIVRDEKTARIYLFSLQKKIQGDIEIILQPSDRSFKIHKISEPVKVKTLRKIESITLEII